MKIIHDRMSGGDRNKHLGKNMSLRAAGIYKFLERWTQKTPYVNVQTVIDLDKTLSYKKLIAMLILLKLN